MECIVLAGGLGTRLQGVIGQYPKCMALVNGKPFLHYIFRYLEEQNCTRVILSLGFKHEVVIEWLAKETCRFAIDHVIEYEPLGTGGGISLAMTKATEDNVAVLNGDTMFSVDLPSLFQFHTVKQADTTLALKEMFDFERYGVVKTNDLDCITAFEEKSHQEHGYINGGVYIVNKDSLFAKSLPAKYSFEKDYFETYLAEAGFFGYKSEAYFIDIGIPEDYQKAQEDFKEMFG